MLRLVLIGAAVAISTAAFAQVGVAPLAGTPPQTTLDLGALNVLMPFLLAVLTAVLGFIGNYLRSHVKNAELQQMITQLQTATEAGAGIAYKYGVEQLSSGGLAHPVIRDAAISQGLSYVLALVPDLVNKLSAVGVTPTSVQSMVEARLYKLLAADPTVTATGPVTTKRLNDVPDDAAAAHREDASQRPAVEPEAHSG